MSAICVLSSSWASRVSISEIAPCPFRTSSCCCIVRKPVWRHGLLTEALAKHTFLAPADAKAAVSVISPSMYCSHGVAGSPANVASRCASCSSKSAWTYHS